MNPSDRRRQFLAVRAAIKDRLVNHWNWGWLEPESERLAIELLNDLASAALQGMIWIAPGQQMSTYATSASPEWTKTSGSDRTIYVLVDPANQRDVK